MHLIGPRHAALPAFVEKLLGGRSERIGHRIPDIGLAVAVEIDGIFQIIRRQELREPHRSGPGAFHVGKFDLSLLQDFQRQQKLVEELLLALAGIGLCCQHADGIALVGLAAVIGLAAEDREQNRRRRAELLLDGGERRTILVVEFAAVGGEPVDRGFLDVIGRRLHEFRLAGGRLFRPAGQHQIGQRVIRLEPARRTIEGRARNTKRLRLRPQRLQPSVEYRIRGG